VAIVIPEIAIVAAVPMVVVLDASAVAIPVAGVETLSIVARGYPASGGVYRPAPISGMPLVVVPDGIPVAVYPDEFRTWTRRKNANHSRRGWRADSDSDGNLGGHKRAGQEQQSDQSLLHLL
jgi:hypothetical protein